MMFLLDNVLYTRYTRAQVPHSNRTCWLCSTVWHGNWIGIDTQSKWQYTLSLYTEIAYGKVCDALHVHITVSVAWPHLMTHLHVHMHIYSSLFFLPRPSILQGVTDEVSYSENIRNVLKIESKIEGGCPLLLDKEQTLVRKGKYINC